MENTNQYDELLVKYLAGEVNAEERRFVEGWIDATTENQRHFEQLKDTWQLSSLKATLNDVLDEVNVEDEWDRLKETISERETRKRVHVEEVNTEVDKPGQKSVLYRFIIWASIAASVILVIGIWKFPEWNRSGPVVVKNARKKTTGLGVAVRREVNTTGKEKRILLPDGSLIVLSGKSEITYREPFANKRDIFLIGKAYFKVTGDKNKPFTVTGGDFSTTALGTEFTVTAFEKREMIMVRLYEGKVVVKANSGMINDIYLSPGQEFTYDRQNLVRLKTFKLKKVAAPEQILNEEVFKDNPAIPQDEVGSWYMFNNQPLAQVLDQLADLYNVEIVYDKKNVQNIYFTGKYNRLESLHTILKRIGTLNTLTITKTDSAFIISK